MKYFKEGSPKTNFTWREAHHFFWGMIMFFLSFVGIFVWPMWIVYVLFFFGLWNMIDDMLQHIIQRGELKEHGHYTTRSFLHWFPYWLGRKLGLKI